MTQKKITLDQLSESIAQCVDNWDMDTLITYACDEMNDKVISAVFENESARFVVLDDLDNSYLTGPLTLEDALKEAEFFDHAHVTELEVTEEHY